MRLFSTSGSLEASTRLIACVSLQHNNITPHYSVILEDGRNCFHNTMLAD